ncbi:MAG: hypothetical protein AB7P21_20330 [Lautropia sp.]
MSKKPDSKPLKARVQSGPAPGRPPKKVYINVLVREATRKKMNQLTRRHGITQGELLDSVFGGKGLPG